MTNATIMQIRKNENRDMMMMTWLILEMTHTYVASLSILRRCYIVLWNRRETKIRKRRRRKRKRRRKKKLRLQPPPRKQQQQRHRQQTTKTNSRGQNATSPRRKSETSSLSSTSHKSKNSKRSACSQWFQNCCLKFEIRISFHFICLLYQSTRNQ